MNSLVHCHAKICRDQGANFYPGIILLLEGEEYYREKLQAKSTLYF